MNGAEIMTIQEKVMVNGEVIVIVVLVTESAVMAIVVVAGVEVLVVEEAVKAVVEWVKAVAGDVEVVVVTGVVGSLFSCPIFTPLTYFFRTPP